MNALESVLAHEIHWLRLNALREDTLASEAPPAEREWHFLNARRDDALADLFEQRLLEDCRHGH